MTTNTHTESSSSASEISEARSTAVIASYPIEDRKSVCYDSDTGVLFIEGNRPDYQSLSTEYKQEFWYYFLGLRKLQALKNSMASPRTLVIEPSRLCNLTCKYCYAHAGPYIFKHIEVDSLMALINRHGFQNAFVFGGDPLVDKEFLYKLHELHCWSSFVISTNGILLDEEFLSSKLVNSRNFTLEIGLEPEEWKARVNINNTPQMGMLKKNLGLLEGRSFVCWVVIPTDSGYITLKEFVDSIETRTHNPNFAVFYWPVYGPILSDNLPPWFDNWIAESRDILTNDELRRRYRNKIPAGNNLNQIRGMCKNEFHFYDTSLPGGAVSVGPDNRLHAWHEMAIVEDSRDVISSDSDPLNLDPTKALSLIYEWANGLNNSECAGCPIRYFCGGLYLDETPGQATCQYLRKTLALDLTNLVANHQGEVQNLVVATKKRFEDLLAKIEKVKREVTKDEWDELVSGKLTLEEAIMLANRYF